jgi:hypothetical protein
MIKWIQILPFNTVLLCKRWHIKVMLDNWKSFLKIISIFFQPKNQSCVHLVCSRPTSHALQILRTLMTVAPKSARTNPDVVSLSTSIAIFVDVKIRHFCGCYQCRNCFWLRLLLTLTSKSARTYPDVVSPVKSF